MITDNLSGTKGTNQSSAIIWLSLNPSLSMSGTPRHYPIANLWYPQPHTLTTNQVGALAPPHFCTFSAQAQGSVFILFQDFYTLQMFTIIIIIIMQNYNITTFIILHCVYCNLVEYCNIVYCGTLCELYYNLLWTSLGATNKPCT